MAAQDFRVKNGIVVAGNAELTGILYPTADGTNRQVIMTDGAGTLSFENLDTVHTDAVNQTTSDIPIGTPVYQVGTSGNAIEVAPADASDPAKMPAVGVVETTLTANGGTGFVTHIGQVSGVDTQTPGFSEGDVIYVAARDGQPIWDSAFAHELMHCWLDLTTGHANGKHNRSEWDWVSDAQDALKEAGL